VCGHPRRECFGGAWRFIEDVGPVVPKTKRARMDELMNGHERGDGEQKILLDFGKIGGGVEHQKAIDAAQVKRRVLRCSQGVQNVVWNQGRKGAAHLSFMPECHVVIGRYTGLVGPGERTAKLHHLAVKALESLGFGGRPCADPRDVKKRKMTVFCGGLAPLVHREEIARVVIKQHRKMKIGVQQTKQAIERQVVLGSDGGAFLMKALDGLLPKKFVGMKHQHVGGRAGGERITQPRRKPVAGGREFRGDGDFFLHPRPPKWLLP
jgi:hypothetical protein